MPATNYAINKTLNRKFRHEPYGLTNYNYWYIGLSLGDIDQYGNGVMEPTDKAYKRIRVSAYANGSSIFTSVSATGIVTNTSPISFNQSSQHWGTIKEVFISAYPAATSVPSSNAPLDDIWFHHPLVDPIPVLDGTKITIPANAMRFIRIE